MKRLLITLYLIVLTISASGQFYVTGDDPGRLKWYSLDTENFKIIFPEGNDSLARVYGSNLEKYRTSVSLTTGYQAGGPGKDRMPVVLHTWNTANGSVAWAPKRMDLFTIPSAYEPNALPWDKMLAIHESRHVTQMQFGMTKALKPFNWFFGEMFNILASVEYPGISHIEGDAVIVETAYSQSGRGRTADFLDYYRVAYDEGVRRSWGQWRFASQKNYSPTYYALGYITVGGIRHFYDCPDYMSQAYHQIARQPYKFGSFYSVAKEVSGKKRFNDVFLEIADSMAVIWKAEADARAPYIPMEAVTKEPRLYTDYISNVFVDNELYAIKKGHLNTPEMVRITEDGDNRISAFSSQTGKVKFQGNRLFWSETMPDERWTMQTHSRIRFMKGRLENGVALWSGDKNLSDNDRLLYNPSVSGDGKFIACVEYKVKGGSSLVVLDAADGSVIRTVDAPEGLQLVETAWIGENVYATGLSEAGYGIYSINDRCESILEAQPVLMKDFGSYGNELMFTCDRTGSNELYHFNLQSGKLTQKTSIRHGGESFAYSPDGKWLYFSSQTVKGKQIFRTPVSELFSYDADLSDRHKYMLAEALTAQEMAAMDKMKAEHPETESVTEENMAGAYSSEPKRYRKFPHMFNVHSWAPLYVNVNNIMNMSYDYTYDLASLGATGIIQNKLSTAVGQFGYSAHRDPYHPDKWRHSGHAKFTYSGLYPIFELSVDFNDRSAIQYNPKAIVENGYSMMSIDAKEDAAPFVYADLKVYVPFDLSSGGWFRGVIPQVSYSFSNDFFNSSMPYISHREQDGAGAPGGQVFLGATDGKNRPMQYLRGNLRAYTMLGTSNSCVYPRWGIGVEMGVSSMLAAMDYYSPMGYAYVYGYVPGFARTHGIRLSVLYQTKLKDSPFGQRTVSIMPRGFAGTPSIGSNLSVQKKSLAKVSAEYGIPIYIGDIAVLNSMLNIKRLVLTPHFDYLFMNPLSHKQSGAPREGLWSAGGTLAFNLESIFWLGWPCTFGVTASYNGGPSFEVYKEAFNARRYYVGPTFNVTF